MSRFRSLRIEMLLALAGSSLLVTIVLGVVSYLLADRAVQRDLNDSFAALRRTLQEARFPLTPSVLQSLADLTGTELATYEPSRRLQNSTSKAAPKLLSEALLQETTLAFSEQLVAGYSCRSFDRPRTSPGSARWVLVFYDADKLRRQRWSAAALPLATGVASTLLLVLVMWSISRRMIQRITDVKGIVHRVAGGDFSPTPEFREADELGELGTAVGKMTNDLRLLWQAVHRQERQRLIHQLAAGLAHQLRNSLTGARMAIDLVHHGGTKDPADPLSVASREIRRTEDYVQRILSVSAERKEEPRPRRVGAVLDRLWESLEIIANHHRVGLVCNVPPEVKACRVHDGTSLSLALENLVLNGLQAGGDRVQLTASHETQSLRAGSMIRFEVRDNGPGISTPDVAEQLNSDIFEPFVTSKPEGLGLGLALVQRAAANLNGSVCWQRTPPWTIFVMTAEVVNERAVGGGEDENE